MSEATVRIKPAVGHNSGQRRGWAKHVEKINTDYKNGYAFEGQFLSEGKETELPVGAIILHVDPFGSVNKGWKEAKLTRLNEDGTETDLIKYTDWQTDKLSIRDAAAEALDQQVGPDLSAIPNDALLAEIYKRQDLLDQLNASSE